MPKAAVIILNWNGERLLREYLPSVIAHTPAGLATVVVADNASSDRSVEVLREEFPEAERIVLDRNYGFAGGYNRAIATRSEEIVVLLNSDVEVTPGWLPPLLETLDAQPGIAAVQPKIKSRLRPQEFEYAGAAGGFIDRLGYPFCRGRIFHTVETDNGQYDTPTDIFWCSGAALCIRREAYLAAGGLDERFFAHMEEIDLCWRLRNAGWHFRYCPSSVVYHLGGGSLPMNHPRKLFLNYRNNLLMLHKNLPPRTLRHLLMRRLLFDSAAAMLLLFQGKPANALAVFRAYRQFFRLRKHYTPPEKRAADACIFPRNIVTAYYLQGKRTFDKLSR